MSTNFYWVYNEPEPFKLITGHQVEFKVDDMDPRIHICKRTSRLLWAQEPMFVRMLCEKHSEEKIIMDEYRDLYTGNQFIEIMDTNNDWYTGYIGQEFS